MIGSASTLYHLGGALRRAAGRVFLTFILVLILVAAASEATLYFLFNQHFYLGSHILSAALGIGWAFAISLFVLVFEVVKGLVTGVKDAAKDVEKQVGDASKIVGGVVESVEGRFEKK
ncbi:MAG TPA: hypothetical protein VGN32_18885 [Ktedonobacterales bacterium]|jgi:hypothetical protein|nr:hypothetical protein [Ktedonobacterales bacterium]